jgi:TIR domain
MEPNTSADVGGNILAYFSHSYRDADRDVNSFFWSLFHDEGFFFTVDPQSHLFSIPYLESMMMLSNCFVAVITRRRDSPLGCSPYILFEYGLALEAQKPALVFVEQGVSGSAFPRDPERIVPFNRNPERLAHYKGDFIRAIRSLASKVRGYRNPDVRLQQPCGLLIRTGSDVEQIYTPAVIRSLTAELSKFGRKLEIVNLEFNAAFEFCLELEKYDFLIMEVRASLQVPWLAGYGVGRAIPSIKVCYAGLGEPRDLGSLPSIISRHKPEHTDEEPVIFWQETSELLEGVTKHVSKFNTERIEFHSKEEGIRYFSRAGRRKAKVFVSNATASNVFVQKLIVELRLESMDFFHYQVKDAIPIGDRWLSELERQIEGTGIFIALITKEFLKSPWCMYELQAARRRDAEGKLRIHPYLLDSGLWDQLTLLGLDVQAVDLTKSDEATSIGEIVKDLDRELKKKDSQPARPPTRDGAQPTTMTDAARPKPVTALVLLEDERRTLVDVLAARLTIADGTARSSLAKGWLMDAQLYAELAGEDYSGSAEMVATTLVTRAEALGVLPTGRRAILMLVTGLRKRERVDHDGLNFLAELERRLESAATI